MRIPDRRRFLDAVNHVETEEIPFFEIDPDMALVNQLLGMRFPLSLHPYELPIPDYIELNKRMGYDMIYFAHTWRLGRKERKDDDGYLQYVDGIMKGRESLTDIWYPDMDDIRRRIEELLALADSSGFGVVCSTVSAPYTVATAVGYEDYQILVVPLCGLTVAAGDRVLWGLCPKDSEPAAAPLRRALPYLCRLLR